MTKHSYSGALWSALVLPGAGQFVLKRYVTGAFFSLIAIASLAVIIAQVVKIAKAIAEYIGSHAIHAEESGFIGAVVSGWKVADTSILTTAFIVFVVTWLLSILDAYRIGDAIDKNVEKTQE